MLHPSSSSSSLPLPSSSHSEIPPPFECIASTSLSPVAMPMPQVPSQFQLPLSTTNAMPTGDDGRCAVCGDEAQGIHFCVKVCRACAAFFRRSTIARRVYRCRRDGNCVIGQREVRCACRACRLAKCLALGMDPNAVQRNRDQIGPRKNRTEFAKGRKKKSLPVAPSADFEAEHNKSYTLLGNASAATEEAFVPSAAEQMFLFRSALPSAFTAPPLSARPQGTSSAAYSNGGDGGQAEGSDSGNASVSSSAFTSPAERHSPSADSVVSTLCFCSSANIQPQIGPHFCATEMPLIAEMAEGYRRLKRLRLSAHRLTGSLSQEHFPQISIGTEEADNRPLKLANYLDNLCIIRTELSLVSEMIDRFFTPLKQGFSEHAKWTLLRNFICPFYLADRFYLTAHRFSANDTRFVLSPYHYMDVAQLGHFFAVEQCKTQPEEIAREFETTFRKALALFADFHTLCLSEGEFAGLMGILFWNDKVDSLSDSERASVLGTRERLFVELYALSSRGGAEAVAATQPATAKGGERFCTIINKFHFSMKISQEISQHFSLANLKRTFEVDQFLHQFNPQTF